MYYQVVTADVYPDESKLETINPVCLIYDADGHIVTNSKSTSFEHEENIPDKLKYAFIAIEDKRFYSHNGIDPKAILRAVKNNVKNGGIKEGASTITQQLVKNVYLSGEKTLNRKLKEIKLASIIEKKYTKDEILELYLNKIYFGEGAYGIKKAAEIYFGKECKNLTLEECATLAAIVKAPTFYDPFIHPDTCLDRRNLVLKEMLKQKEISETEYSAAKSKPITLTEKIRDDTKNFTDEIIAEALKIIKSDSASDLSGYKIYCGISSDYQSVIPAPTLPDEVKDYSVLITENISGQIVGYRSTTGMIKRVPASAAKPWLVYAPAIEENLISEATKILDEKTDFGGYSPSNANKTYAGYVNVKDALSKSLNIPTVKIANALGMDKIKNYAEKLEIEFTNNDLSVALGNLTGGVTLSELSSAYSPFTCDGQYKRSQFISKIISPSGKTIYDRDNEKVPTQVFSPGTCYIINDILRETARNGTAKKLASLPFAVYAKTGTNGTSSGNSDAYCIAYTQDYTVSVWLGNSDGSYMPNNVNGGGEPTNIAGEILKRLYNDKKPNSFIPPDDVAMVTIDKNAYDERHEQIIATNPKVNDPTFWYIKGSEPTTYSEGKITPTIKSSKITYNNGIIYVNIVADDNVFYELRDNNESVVATGNGVSELQVNGLKNGKTYTYTLTPYILNDKKKVFGQKIKLPSIKIDGNKKSEWWND